MSIPSALYDRLRTAAGLAALVGTRIYPGLMPQGVTYPAVSVHLVSGPQTHAMGTDPDHRVLRYQVSCWSHDPDECRAVADQVGLALNRWRAASSGVQEAWLDNTVELPYEPETQSYHVASDILVSALVPAGTLG